MQPPVRKWDQDEVTIDGSSPSISDPVPGLAIVNAILRNRFRIAAMVAGVCAAVVTYKLITPRTYISEASFSLQSSSPGRLSGIAAQFGLALPSSEGAQSPAYYVELLGSPAILAAAANYQYRYTRDGVVRTGTLADVYNVKERDPSMRTDIAVRGLLRVITAVRSKETGIVSVKVSARSPELARQILVRLLDLLNEFNRKTRQSQATNERQFVERRMSEISGDLRVAEDRLQSFLQRNRGGYMNTPDLSFEHDRLAREVSLRQQVYTALAQSYEQARIDEVRDTPAITVIESPSLPVRPSPRGLARTLIIAFFVSSLLGMVPPTVRVLLLVRRRSQEDEIEEFQRLRAQLWHWPRAAKSWPD